MPANLGSILRSYRKVLVPEVNEGQLAFVIRGLYPGVDPLQYNRMNGKPLRVAELKQRLLEVLRGAPSP
jgi:2-oxoglutarate ferredoxin oxidoreductase subunit alpha